VLKFTPDKLYKSETLELISGILKDR